MNNKNLVSDCPGGGGCTVTLSGPWTIGSRSWEGGVDSGSRRNTRGYSSGSTLGRLQSTQV